MDSNCQVARIFYFIFPRFTEPYESIFIIMVHHAMLGIRAGDA